MLGMRTELMTCGLRPYRGGDDGGSSSSNDSSGWSVSDAMSDFDSRNDDGPSPGSSDSNLSDAAGLMSDFDSKNTDVASGQSAGWSLDNINQTDPVTGRTMEEQFQYDTDANNSAKGQAAYDALSSALNNGSWNFGWDSNASRAGGTLGSLGGGPIGGVVGAIGGGILGGTTYSPGVGFSSPENQAAIAAAMGAGPTTGTQQGTAEQANSNTGFSVGASANDNSGAYGTSDSGTSGGGQSSGSTGGSSVANTAAKVGVISLPSSTNGTKFAGTGTLIPLAEQIWWGRN